MTTWASTQNFMDRYDSRVVSQLSNDTNSTTSNNTTLQAMLDDAASDIRAAVLRGGIYTTTQLDDLNASGDTQLIRLNCDVAIKLLADRRAGDVPQGVKDIAKRTSDFLNELESGKKVLNVQINRTADTPAMVNLTLLQRQNLGDITANEFWSNETGTNTTYGPTT